MEITSTLNLEPEGVIGVRRSNTDAPVILLERGLTLLLTDRLCRTLYVKSLRLT